MINFPLILNRKNKMGKLHLIGDDEEIVIGNSRLCNEALFTSLLKTPLSKINDSWPPVPQWCSIVVLVARLRSHYSMPWCYNLGLKMNGMNGIIDIILLHIISSFFTIHFRFSSIARIIGVKIRWIYSSKFTWIK